MISKILGIYLLFFVESSFALEVDSFSVRHLAVDRTEFLNRYINEELDKAAAKVSNCSKRDLQNSALASLSAFSSSNIEKVFDKDPEVSRTAIKFENSIYKNTEEDQYYGSWGCCAGLFKYKGTYLSTDKLGHFFHTGFEMYTVGREKKFTDEKNYALISSDPDAAKNLDTRGRIEEFTLSFDIKNDGKGDLSIMEASDYQERTLWGKVGTGVFSYADIVANYEGSKFWSEFASGENPYFVCENGRWKKKRDFTWDDYISDAWDEGINCSVYVSDKMTATVKKNIESTMRNNSTGDNVSCPLEPNKCGAIAKRYKGFLSGMVGPACAKAASSTKHRNVKPKKGLR